MSFELIQDDVIYKEEISYTEPYWLRGVYYEGSETVTYPTFGGTLEPYKDGETSLQTPSGTMSSDAKILYTDEPLQVYRDFDADSGLADKVYLRDPETGKHKPQAYVVYDREDNTINASFSLLDTATSYIIVREGKL